MRRRIFYLKVAHGEIRRRVRSFAGSQQRIHFGPGGRGGVGDSAADGAVGVSEPQEVVVRDVKCFLPSPPEYRGRGDSDTTNADSKRHAYCRLYNGATRLAYCA